MDLGFNKSSKLASEKHSWNLSWEKSNIIGEGLKTERAGEVERGRWEMESQVWWIGERGRETKEREWRLL